MLIRGFVESGASIALLFDEYPWTLCEAGTKAAPPNVQPKMNRSVLPITALLMLAACTPQAPQQAAQISKTTQAAVTPVPTSTAVGQSPLVRPSTSPTQASQMPVAAVSSPKPRDVTMSGGRAVIPQTAVTQVPQSMVTPSEVVMLPPDANPEIFAYEFHPSTVRAGETVVGNVTASSNVASVEVRIATYSINMTKVNIGYFALTYKVPQLPAPFHGTYAVHIIARNTRGDSTERMTSLTMQ